MYHLCVPGDKHPSPTATTIAKPGYIYTLASFETFEDACSACAQYSDEQKIYLRLQFEYSDGDTIDLNMTI